MTTSILDDDDGWTSRPSIVTDLHGPAEEQSYARKIENRYFKKKNRRFFTCP